MSDGYDASSENPHAADSIWGKAPTDPGSDPGAIEPPNAKLDAIRAKVGSEQYMSDARHRAEVDAEFARYYGDGEDEPHDPFLAEAEVRREPGEDAEAAPEAARSEARAGEGEAVQVGGFEFSVPEELRGEGLTLNEDSDLVRTAAKLASERGLSQADVDQLTAAYFAETFDAADGGREAEFEALGPNGEQVIAGINSYAATELSASEHAQLKQYCQDANSVRVAALLIERMKRGRAR